MTPFGAFALNIYSMDTRRIADVPREVMAYKVMAYIVTAYIVMALYSYSPI